LQHIYYFIALVYNIIYYCIDDDTIPYQGVRGKGTVRFLRMLITIYP